MATFRRSQWTARVIMLSLRVVIVLIIVILVILSISVVTSRDKDSLTQARGGSRTNYSIPSVDIFVDDYLSKQVAIVSNFFPRDSEPYTSFMERLHLQRKNLTRLRLNFAKDGSPVNLTSNSLKRFYSEITQLELYDPSQNTVVDLLKDLAVRPIVTTDSRYEYTHPTLILTLDDGAVGVFKAKRSTMAVEMDPDLLYIGEFERYNAEIAAFHLDRVLGFHRVPPTIGRKINASSDIVKSKLIVTYISPAKNHCFLLFCKEYINNLCSSCGDPDIIEGSFTISLPGKNVFTDISENVHPWKRSYNMTKTAWELNDGYCESSVKTDPRFSQGRLLLDLMDMAVFDFLIGNMDRHRYERLKDFGGESFVLHTENAKGFGKYKYDCMSCIAPLRQCCLIRLSTLAKLIKLYQGPDSLSQVMRQSLNSDPLSPVLLEPHLDALDRRLGKVIKVVSDCINNGRSWDKVVIDDSI